MNKVIRKLVILSGPSGTGKTTLANLFEENNREQYQTVRTVTTRTPRFAGEPYIFTTETEFLKIMERDGFLETTCYNNALYGSPKETVEEIWQNNKTPIWVINPNGRQQIIDRKYENIQVLSVFLVATPFLVYERLVERDGLSFNLVNRLRLSLEEIQQSSTYDALIVNDDMENALMEFTQTVFKWKTDSPSNLIKVYLEEAVRVLVFAARTVLIQDFGREPIAEEVAALADYPVEKTSAVLKRIH